MQDLPKHLWHNLPEEDALAALKTDHHEGLSHDQVEERRRLFGANSISAQQGIHPFKRFLLQFHNPLIYILLVAVGVTFLLAEYIDSAVILAVVLANAIIGFVQEAKAEEAINSLKSMLSSEATVIRDGQRQTVQATELVPGDIVLLASGDKVPADMRLFKCRDLQVDESALTGESVAVQKERTQLEQDTVLADRINMAFAGTLATYGSGAGVVIATGDDTETGKIADMISQAVSLDTPLTQKIKAFSRILLIVILALAAITFGVGLLHGQTWVDTFIAAVALSVAAIPEGLPAVVTITLAIGVRRMALRNAIIRKLPAVETLGSTTIICSDKTGTLTENQMTVQKIMAGGRLYEVSGSGYQPEGELRTQDDHTLQPDTVPEPLHQCLLTGLLCNDSRVLEAEGQWHVEGDPTEGALITSAQKAGLDRSELERKHQRLDTIPFESDRQYMATLHRYTDDAHIMLIKGSLEQVLARCQDALDSAGKASALDSETITKTADQFADQGLRVLAFAARTVPTDTADLNSLEQTENEPVLTFLGLQAMIDPPREEAIQAVATCQKAGIDVKMITGDHALTARAIAGQIGIRNPDPEGGERQVLTGRQLEQMTDHELLDAAERVSVFARVAPEQKLKLVTALQAHRHVVAMTGDGVNDAPALKKADIGVAMGIAGTEVSKEAADMVLTDDNFATIEAAVEEGRTVFDNLVKFITWILPTNLGQGLVIMVAILISATLPVLPVQALWLNMTTAVFLGLMLAFEPREAGIMTRPPRSPDSPILSGEMIGRIVSVSTLLLIGAFSLFQWAQALGESNEVARTLAVTLFVVVQSVFLLNCRSLTVSLFRTPAFSNPWIWGGIATMLLVQLAYIYTPVMNTLFQSAPLTPLHWAIMLAYGALVLLLIEGEKALWRHHKNRNAESGKVE
ncbi:cation-transporting P-type ATPase [Natronospirillum operosum]|uniref:Cation-transporting P-type ATPase n=1 Tax=Natronospirillum operosum TaxID=2759953 RepID=A0A4Z0WEH2_9GAMM|nr:cation-transporting P-type ATPase [Natronospirillum operosum]TGG93331.1 cation-transporting P-type ATPase [Natronospirillum operosum]